MILSFEPESYMAAKVELPNEDRDCLCVDLTKRPHFRSLKLESETELLKSFQCQERLFIQASSLQHTVYESDC